MLEARRCPTACLGRPAAARRSGEEPGGGRRGLPHLAVCAAGHLPAERGTHTNKKARGKALPKLRGRGRGAARRRPRTFGAGSRPLSSRGAAPRRSPVLRGGREERRRIGDGAVRCGRAGKWRHRAAPCPRSRHAARSRGRRGFIRARPRTHGRRRVVGAVCGRYRCLCNGAAGPRSEQAVTGCSDTNTPAGRAPRYGRS